MKMMKIDLDTIDGLHLLPFVRMCLIAGLGYYLHPGLAPAAFQDFEHPKEINTETTHEKDSRSSV